MEITLLTVTVVKSPYLALLKCNCQAQGRNSAGGRGLEEHEARLCILHAYYISLGDEHVMCPVGFRSRSPSNFVSRFLPEMFSSAGTERGRLRVTSKRALIMKVTQH
jgi:hypothetical protein